MDSNGRCECEYDCEDCMNEEGEYYDDDDDEEEDDDEEDDDLQPLSANMDAINRDLGDLDRTRSLGRAKKRGGRGQDEVILQREDTSTPGYLEGLQRRHRRKSSDLLQGRPGAGDGHYESYL